MRTYETILNQLRASRPAQDEATLVGTARNIAREQAAAEEAVRANPDAVHTVLAGERAVGDVLAPLHGDDVLRVITHVQYERTYVTGAARDLLAAGHSLPVPAWSRAVLTPAVLADVAASGSAARLTQKTELHTVRNELSRVMN